MGVLIAVVVIVVLLALLVFGLSVRIVKQYEQGVLFRLGRVLGPRKPGFRLIIPFADVLRRVSLRIVTMPIQSQGIITRDHVSVDVSAVAYYKVVDAIKSVVAIKNVRDAIGQIAQTALRKVVGQHTLDQMLAETDTINLDPGRPAAAKESHNLRDHRGTSRPTPISTCWPTAPKTGVAELKKGHPASWPGLDPGHWMAWELHVPGYEQREDILMKAPGVRHIVQPYFPASRANAEGAIIEHQAG